MLLQQNVKKSLNTASHLEFNSCYVLKSNPHTEDPVYSFPSRVSSSYLFISLNRTQVTIRIQYFFPPSNIFFPFYFIFYSTQNKRTLSAIRQRTLTVRCSPYLFTVHVYTHTKKIVHHRYYISNLHPPTSWMGQSECLKTIIFIDSACIQCSLKLTHTHPYTHCSLHTHHIHACTHTTRVQVQHRGISVALFLSREGLLHLHSTLRANSLVRPILFWQCRCILMC